MVTLGGDCEKSQVTPAQQMHFSACGFADLEAQHAPVALVSVMWASPPHRHDCWVEEPLQPGARRCCWALNARPTVGLAAGK